MKLAPNNLFTQTNWPTNQPTMWWLICLCLQGNKNKHQILAGSEFTFGHNRKNGKNFLYRKQENWNEFGHIFIHLFLSKPTVLFQKTLTHHIILLPVFILLFFLCVCLQCGSYNHLYQTTVQVHERAHVLCDWVHEQ